MKQKLINNFNLWLNELPWKPHPLLPLSYVWHKGHPHPFREWTLFYVHATLIHNWAARRWICESWPMFKCWWLQPPSANVVRFMKINQWTNIYIKKVEHTCWNTYLGLHKWCWRYTNLMCTRGLYYTGCWPKRGTNNGNWSLQSQNDIA